MLDLKPGVRAAGLKPEALLGILITHGVFQYAGLGLTITSITDGTHKRNSKHYSGMAFDIRTKDLPPHWTPQSIASLLVPHLGADYDVVIEVDHIHVEFDPKGDAAPSP